MGEDKSGLYITTIVGVVAVLALVLLYLNGSGGLSASASPTGAVIRSYGAQGAAGYSGLGAGSETVVPTTKAYAGLPYCARAIGVLTDDIRANSNAESKAFNKLVPAKACSGYACYSVDPVSGEVTPAPYGCVNGRARAAARADQALLYN